MAGVDQETVQPGCWVVGTALYLGHGGGGCYMCMCGKTDHMYLLH